MNLEQLSSRIDDLETDIYSTLERLERSIQNLHSRIDGLEYQALRDVKYDVSSLERNFSDLQREVSNLRYR